MFSFILCVGVLRERGEIDDEVWRFFLLTQAETVTVAGGADSLKIKSETGDKRGIVIKLSPNYNNMQAK